MFQRIISLVVLGMFLFTLPAGAAEPKAECQPVEEKNVKVEGYISKKFRKELRSIKKEFAEMGNTRTVIRAYPMGDTADVFAIGRCVPAYIARHVLNTAIKYTSGIGSLVLQDFVHVHWIGMATTMFDEPSQKKVTAEQVQQLLNPELSDKEFHVLYRKLSVQDKLVPFFGLQVPNAKIPGASTILQKN